jgi:hypothetical protein
VGKIFSRILLRLLCDQESKLEVVNTKRGIVELIDIGKKANVLRSSFGKRILGD